VFDEQKVLTANSEIQQIEGDESFDGEEGPSHKKAKKKPKETFESVQCLKCGQWVKGRGICLLYHMNTRLGQQQAFHLFGQSITASASPAT